MSVWKYNQKISDIDVCHKINTSGDNPQVTVYHQNRGPQGVKLNSQNCVGDRLGFGCGATIAEATKDAVQDAINNMRSGKV